VWFFMAYPSQSPRAIVDLSADATSIEQQAISQLERLGYSTPLYEIETSFHARNDLLDSLQLEMGRKEMIEYFKQNEVTNIENFYWKVSFRRKSADEEKVVIEAGPEKEGREDVDVINAHFDDEGQFIELVNSSHI